MADTHPTMPQSTTSSQATPKTPTCPPSSKRRKIIGQCPTCAESFALRHELRAHMADPSHHAPASDSDAISFGELSSDYDSTDEPMISGKQQSANNHEDEPTLENDGFEFSSSNPLDSSDINGGWSGFTDTTGGQEDTFMPAPAPDQGSIHTLPDCDDQPGAECTPIEHPPARPRTVRGGALGVLYCGTCDKLFGNERVFKRHFMFAPRHGGEERDVRELYYKVWGRSWGEEAREGRGEEMEM